MQRTKLKIVSSKRKRTENEAIDQVLFQQSLICSFKEAQDEQSNPDSKLFLKLAESLLKSSKKPHIRTQIARDEGLRQQLLGATQILLNKYDKRIIKTGLMALFHLTSEESVGRMIANKEALCQDLLEKILYFIDTTEEEIAAAETIAEAIAEASSVAETIGKIQISPRGSFYIGKGIKGKKTI